MKLFRQGFDLVKLPTFIFNNLPCFSKHLWGGKKGEIRKCLPKSFDTNSAGPDLGIVDVMGHPKHLLSNPLYARLGRGEQSTIAQALQTGSLFCSDDYQVRKMAEKLSVPVIGTLGLCKLAYKQHYFNNPSEYSTIIDLLSQDLRLSPELIRWAKIIED
jgi:predicted nucleic acid-binding protein